MEETGRGSPGRKVIPNTPEALRKLVGKGPRPLAACYEAGPTGCDTHRLLVSLGVPCDVIAPTLTPRRPGRRVKTDRLDARMLARLHRAGEVTPIRVPSPDEEALRDLVRVREDLKDDRKRARQRLRSFLFRHARRHEGWRRLAAELPQEDTPTSSSPTIRESTRRVAGRQRLPVVPPILPGVVLDS